MERDRQHSATNWAALGLVLVDGADDGVGAAVRVLWEDLVDLPLPIHLLLHLQRQQQQQHNFTHCH